MVRATATLGCHRNTETKPKRGVCEVSLSTAVHVRTNHTRRVSEGDYYIYTKK